MGYSVDVTSQTFSADVLEASFQQPVLVDFFAQWCGPCKMLKPVLEQVAQEYDIIVAKVDIDQHPDLAKTYGVEGVPDVRVVQQGEVKPGFVGMMPEPQLRQFLGNLNLQSVLEQRFDEIQTSLDSGDAGAIAQAQTQLQQLLNDYPDNRELRFQTAELLMQSGNLDAAQSALAAVIEGDRFGDALKGMLTLHHVCQHPTLDTDLDRAFVKAARLVTEDQDFEAAFEELLEIIRRDRQFRDDGARKTMLALFTLLGDTHPLTLTYRKQLMLALY